MIEDRLFGSTVSLISKSLDLHSLRHEIITTNIANVSTPNYRALDLRFHEALQAQMQPTRSPSLVRTHPVHFPSTATSRNGTESFITAEETNRVGADGNSVDEEREMVKLAESQMSYQSLITILSRKLISMKSAIHEGGR